MIVSGNKRKESEQSLFNKFRNKFFIKQEKQINQDNKKANKLIIKMINDSYLNFILWIFKKRLMIMNPYKVIYGHYYYDDIIHYKDILEKNNKFLDKKSNISKISDKELYRNSSNQIISNFDFDIISNLVKKLNEVYKDEHGHEIENADVDYTYNKDQALVDINEPIKTKFDDNKKILEIL